MATVFLEHFRAFHWMFGRFEQTLFRGFSGSEFNSFALKCPRQIWCVFSTTRRSGVHLSCMSLSESEEKRWLLKQRVLPSTCLLPAEHIISHHDGGLLLEIQQSAWPGPREHSDRYQTRDGWHTTRTLTVSPFSLFFLICRHGYHTKCKASDACYRWPKTVPVDGTCTCLPAWLADNRSQTSSDRCYNRTTACRSCVFISLQKRGELILLCIPVSAKSCRWQCSIYIASDAKMSPQSTGLLGPRNAVSYEHLWRLKVACWTIWIISIMSELIAKNKLEMALTLLLVNLERWFYSLIDVQKSIIYNISITTVQSCKLSSLVGLGTIHIQPGTWYLVPAPNDFPYFQYFTLSL